MVSSITSVLTGIQVLFLTVALHEYESGIRKNISLSNIEIEPVQDIIFKGPEKKIEAL